MKQKIRKLVKEYLGLKVIIAAIVGALFSWGILWVLPSNKVDVGNFPQKELTCTLDISYQMMIRKSSDNRFRIMFDGKEVKNPYAYNVTCELKVCTTKKPENPSVFLTLPVAHELSVLCMI